MAAEDKIIEKLIDYIEGSINGFNNRLPKVQEEVFNKVLEMTGDLETTGGRIKPSVKNIKIIAKIKGELNKVIFNNEYADELDKLVKSYEEITKLQNQYFSTLVGKFTVPKVLAEVQALSIESLIDAMGKDAIAAEFTSPIRNILTKNMTTGGTKQEFIQQAKDFILDTPEKDGKLVRYSKQIVSDALNQYSRQYHQLISDDLGFEWFRYSGQIEETTRDLCKELIRARDGCLPYIHKSQLNDIVNGKICGKQVPIYKATDLPYGMYPGTNAANFQVLAGGYNCRHEINGVPARRVPKELKDKFTPGWAD